MPGRILILDENVTRRIAVAARLSAAFFDVRIAATADEGWAALRDWQPGMILLSDEADSAECGDAFCRRVRSIPAYAEILLVMIAQGTTPARRVAMLAAGADDVFERSQNDRLLRSRLLALMRGREAVRSLRLPDNGLRLPGLADAPGDIIAPTRVHVVAPDAAQAARWQAALASRPGVIATAQAADRPVNLPDRCLVLIGTSPATLRQTLRTVAALNHGDAEDTPPVLLVDGGQTPAAGLEEALDLGAAMLVPDGFDADEIVSHLHRMQALSSRRAMLKKMLSDGIRHSVTDPLTGLYNRRYALPRLDSALDENGAGCAALLVDLDRFKRVNDRHGHAAGDAVLVAIARILRETLREGDLVARLGGEEFLVMLPKTDALTAYRMATRLCMAVRKTPITVDGLAEPLQLTISVGVAVGGKEDRTGADLLARADRALYDAKRAGRDKVMPCPAQRRGSGACGLPRQARA